MKQTVWFEDWKPDGVMGCCSSKPRSFTLDLMKISAIMAGPQDGSACLVCELVSRQGLLPVGGYFHEVKGGADGAGIYFRLCCLMRVLLSSLPSAACALQLLAVHFRLLSKPSARWCVQDAEAAFRPAQVFSSWFSAAGSSRNFTAVNNDCQKWSGKGGGTTTPPKGDAGHEFEHPVKISIKNSLNIREYKE